MKIKVKPKKDRKPPDWFAIARRSQDAYRQLRREERRLYREAKHLDDLLNSAISTLASIASITIFDDTEETVRYCLDSAQELAAEALEELDYKPGYIPHEFIDKCPRLDEGEDEEKE